MPFDIEGVVVKIDSQADQDYLGTVGRDPRFAVVWKFPRQVAETILKKVELQVGRTGVITAVGNLKPVHLGGAVIRRVTLHNESEIISKIYVSATH